MSDPTPLPPVPLPPPGTLPLQLFQFRGHYHPGHHWLVPLSFAVHWDLTLVVANVLALRAHSGEGLAVYLCQSKPEGSIISFPVWVVVSQVLGESVLLVHPSYCYHMLGSGNFPTRPQYLAT